MTVELQKYLDCLTDIMRRLNVLRAFITKQKTTGFVITDVEFISIQFRKLIELIAFSSLVANKAEYSAQYEKFEKHWNARLMFRDLKRINHDFYPKPSTSTEKRGKDGTIYFDFETKASGFLTEADAVNLYEECASVLHASNPYREQRDIRSFYKKFPEYLERISNLLAHHTIVLKGGSHMVIGIIPLAEEGFVQVFQGAQLTGDDEIKAKEVMD